MSRVLVTGASGFIGRRALEPLTRQGVEVYGVGRSVPADLPRNVRWLKADLLDPDERAAAVNEAAATHLLHLAWYAEPGRFWTDPENVRWVGASLDLVERFASAGGRRAVLAGTCAEYDWSTTEPLSEAASALAPSTLYGTCKDATRRVVQGLGSSLGLSVAWARIFFLYGPREHPARLVASVASALVRGERAPTSEGSQVRDFMHVDDVAGAFVALLSSEVTGAVNIGSGEGVTVRDVVEQIARAARREDLLDLGALASRPGDPPRIVADALRLHDSVAFTPAISLEEGLTRTVEWWQEATE